MSKDQRRIAFLKVLIAAAWADERLSPEEIRILSYYLQRLQISAEEYETLKDLLEKPLDSQKARALVEEQLQVLSSTEEQRTLLAAVEDIVASDNKLDPREEAFLRELRKLTYNPSTVDVFISRLHSLWSSPPPLPSEAGAPVSRFLQLRLLEHFRRRITLSRARVGLLTDDGIEEEDLYRVVIWATLLTRVAQADSRMCPKEKEKLIDILGEAGDLLPSDLEVVADLCSDGSLGEVELPSLVRELVQLTSVDQSTLLDCLFLVASADGQLREIELRTIRDIAQGAGFSEQAFRASWQRCKRRIAAGWN